MAQFVALLPWMGLVGGVFALFLREKGVEKGASATALLPLAFPPVLVAIAAVAAANFLSGEPKGALYFLAAGAAWSTIVTLVIRSITWPPSRF